MNKLFKQYTLAIIALLLSLALPTHAESIIGMNFCSRYPIPHLEGEVADDCSNWTDSVDVDQTGEANGTDRIFLGTNELVTCSWTSPNSWDAGSENESFQQLFRVYLDDGGDGPTVIVNGLDDWMAAEGYTYYILRVYHSTDTNNASFAAVDVTVNETIVDTFQATNMWYTDGGSRAFVDSGPLTAGDITIETQPRTGIGSGDTRATIAGIKITGINVYNPINPTPENFTEAPANQTLTWQQDPAISGMNISYNVYVGTDPNDQNPTYYGLAPVKTTTSDESDFFYTPAEGFEYSSTYYWRVDAIVIEGQTSTTYVGNEWSFTTQPDSARIELDPVSTTVPMGTDQITLTIDGINITNYQWYKDGQPLEDDTTDTQYVGQDTASLTIYDIQLEDEGDYYCQVDNSLNIPADSQSAQVITERMIGWWKLDGDLTDSIDEIYPGAVTHDGTATDPNYVDTGIANQAYEIKGTPETMVIVTDSADYFDCYPRGYTVSAWVNMPIKNTGSWGAFVCKQASNKGSGFGLFHQAAGRAVYVLRQSFNDLFSYTEIDDSNWHLVVGTYDAQQKLGKVYVDGILRGQAQNDGVVTGSGIDLFFGAELIDGSGSPYTGLLDDVRIWSYPVEPHTIGMLYTDLMPGIDKICVEYPEFDIAGPDGYGEEFRDCIVNLYDLMPLIDAWMQSNIVKPGK